MPFSRSYFLEKEIRALLFFETHDAIDYGHAADRYSFLLSKIKFESHFLVERYRKALRRAEEKHRIITLIEGYEVTGDLQALRDAYFILHSPDYQNLEEYGFTSLWHRRTRISDDWFQKHFDTASTNTNGG